MNKRSFQVDLFYKRHLAELEDRLKEALRKQHYARVDNIRAQMLGIRALLRTGG